jgi:uncharacterized protein
VSSREQRLCNPNILLSASGAYAGLRRRRDMDRHELERLVQVAMPYGKYKGRIMADLPGHYLNWFARTGFPAGELGRLLALMHELDHNGLSALLDPLRGAARS